MATAKNTPTYFMRQALALAKRGYGNTSPNPMVGAIVVKNRKIIGKGYHKAAGFPHAEVEAIFNATRRNEAVKGADVSDVAVTHDR